MEADGDFLTGMKDTRNVKSKAGIRRKPSAMVTKSYSHKAVEKMLYSKGEKYAKQMEALKITEEEKRKEEEEPLDEFTAKKLKKQKDKQQKTDEKKMKKQEKDKLTKEETIAFGAKHKGKK